MLATRCISRPTAFCGVAGAVSRRATLPVSNLRQLQSRNIGTSPKPNSHSRRFLNAQTATALAFTVAAGSYIALRGPTDVHAEKEKKPVVAEVVFEPERQQASSQEENRDIISSQHLQVKKSWENPGVYAWGSNAGRAVAPESTEATIKNPRRIQYFDGKLLRDMKITKDFGAAITDTGDLVQWGAAFSDDITEPTPTLRGKNLVKIEVSKDRILGLTAGGDVHSIPVAKNQQSPQESRGWFSFLTGGSTSNIRTITPQGMGWGERITDISSGQEHCLMLTSKGRVFSAASGSQDFPTKGQLGIPGLSWENRPEGPYFQPHEIKALKGYKATQIATGDYHSLVLDNDGRVFVFGGNDLGQLGFDYNSDAPCVEFPVVLPVSTLYRSTGQEPKVTGIAAGGSNSFLTIDARGKSDTQSIDSKRPDRITADTWGFGQGISGSLGNGRWTHMQDSPSKIKSLSGLSEYDEATNSIVPIRIARLSVGATHSAAVLDNQTYVSASTKGSDNDTNYGADVLLWGGNEFFQLGTGKRNNINIPQYIPPLDKLADKEKGRTDIHRFQITPKKVVKVNGKKANVEQRIVCGRDVTAVYSAV